MKNFDERYQSAERRSNIIFYSVMAIIICVLCFIGRAVLTVDVHVTPGSAGEIVGEFREGMER